LSAAPTESKELPSLWRPLRLPVFRNLLAADVVSDVGTFMQNVGAAWLMVSLNAGPFYVALTQTASSLPFFIFALPAGSVGDIVDRRKLILFTEVWMTAIAVLLALFTFGGIMTPLLLLLLTFALSAGDAFETPTWRAVLPELVPKEDLASASALNGIEFNFARAIGPALAGFLIAAAGVGAAFSVNALSFMGVILVIALWKRPATRRSTPAETVTGATAAGLRYVRYSPALRRLMIRSGLAMFFSGCLALLPSVANEVSRSSLVYGILLGVFGVGAVLGALVMQRMRAVLSLEALISGSLLLFGLCTIAVGMFRNLAVLNAVMLIGGAARLVFLSLFNVILLTRAPDWVRARVLAVSLLVIQGGLAGGSALWGALAERSSIHAALLCAGAGTVAAAAFGPLLRLPKMTVDLTPWAEWRLPAVVHQDLTSAESGPVLVTVEYEVEPQHEQAFLEAVRRLERIRRRDGAYEWGIFRDLENLHRFVETFHIDSWAEHLRQHERTTRADREVLERVRKFARATPAVRHLVTPP